jgi:hypothetical protein
MRCRVEYNNILKERNRQFSEESSRLLFIIFLILVRINNQYLIYSLFYSIALFHRKQKYEERIRSIIDKIKDCLVISPLFPATSVTGAGVVWRHSVCADDDSVRPGGGDGSRPPPSGFGVFPGPSGLGFPRSSSPSIGGRRPP